MKRSMKILWLTIKVGGVVVSVSLLLLGGYVARLLTPMVIDHYVDKIARNYDRIVNGPSVVVQQVEPEYGDGVRGIVVKYAKKHKVPVALALAIAGQESALDTSNMSLNIAPKYITKGKNYKAGPERWKYTAWGVMQILPAYTMKICGYSDFTEIYGEENLERNIECGMMRLRHDFELYKNGSEAERWKSTVVDYFGADVDGYKGSVLAKAYEFALEVG